jgi:polyphenol oxidase
MIEAETLKHPRLTHGFFTRGGGTSTGLFASLNCGLGSGDDLEAVQRNRGTVARQLGVQDARLITAHQVHSRDCIVVDQPWSTDARPKVDAMVTSKRGIAIGVLTADCAPVLFADPEAGVVGAAHAGWKGALSGVTDATIEQMEKQGAVRSRITAVIGPTISQANYEVGPEFINAFASESKGNEQFFKPSMKSGHHMFDLPGYLIRRLRDATIGSVTNLALCTYADETRFYSFRRATHRNETDYGRLIAAIALA